ncbi:hypothetical protein [Nonomuraea candida]|uniref:hypothetical protein n=1 Tax=Nonomuraea candida TaxID=359159 RepID=UPI0005BD2D6E|nr:hypothetical protein [Nonomuraea candida]
MGVRGWLLRLAARRPRVLVVACPYGTRARLLVEAELDRRGWPVALSPAEATVMVVCGVPAPGEPAQAVERVWQSLPGPRAQVRLTARTGVSEVTAALDRAVTALGDETTHLADPHDDPGRPGGGGHGGDGHGGDGHGGHGHGGHGHGGHHEHGMGAPGGVAMAGRGDDRDGLKLDRLHVPLGPVLADWPAGLVVETVLQGDLIQEATVRALPPGESGVAFWDDPGWGPAGVGGGEVARRRAAGRLDSLQRLLGVAGWPAAAREARRLRDRLLAGAEPAGVSRDYDRFARRVRRSAVLRWMLRGLGVVEGGPGVPEWMRGDVLDRAYGWLDRAREALGEIGDHRPLPRPSPRAGRGRRGGWEETGATVALLPGLLAGAELAVARLIVASLDPDLERLPTGPAAGGG